MSRRPDASKPVRPAQPTQSAEANRSQTSPLIRNKSPSLPAVERAKILRRLYPRRTLIPILLTLGVLFCGIGAAQWMTDPDYPFSASNLRWCAIALPVVGIILLALAAVNMSLVAGELKRVKG
jgi:hypothetical protein